MLQAVTCAAQQRSLRLCTAHTAVPMPLSVSSNSKHMPLNHDLKLLALTSIHLVSILQV